MSLRHYAECHYVMSWRYVIHRIPIIFPFGQNHGRRSKCKFLYDCFCLYPATSNTQRVMSPKVKGINLSIKAQEANNELSCSMPSIIRKVKQFSVMQNCATKRHFSLICLRTIFLFYKSQFFKSAGNIIEKKSCRLVVHKNLATKSKWLKRFILMTWIYML